MKLLLSINLAVKKLVADNTDRSNSLGSFIQKKFVFFSNYFIKTKNIKTISVLLAMLK